MKFIAVFHNVSTPAFKICKFKIFQQQMSKILQNLCNLLLVQQRNKLFWIQPQKKQIQINLYPQLKSKAISPLQITQNTAKMEALSIFKNFGHTKIKNPFHSLNYSLVLCMSSFYFGYTLIYLSAIDFAVIAQVYSIDFDVNLAQGIMQGIMPIGGTIGALTSTYFVSKLSRRQIIFVFNLLAASLCLLSLYTDYRVFLAVRFLQGACAGLFSSIVPMIVKENAPIQMASITGTLPNLCIIFGLFFLYFFDFIMGLLSGDRSGASTWKIIFLFPLISIAIQSFLLWRVYPYQTIKYLAQNQQITELKSLIKEFYREDAVQQLCSQNLKIYGSSQTDASGKQKQVYNSKAGLIYGLFYAILAPLAGINVMMSYCGDVASKIFPSLKDIIGALLMLAFFTFSAISIGFVGKYGRKDMTIWGTYGIALTLYSITIGYFLAQLSPLTAQMIVFFSMVAYLFVYGMSYAPIMWMWLAEALQPSKLGYAVTVNWLGAALIMILFPLIQAVVPNQGYIFAFFGTCTFLSLAVTKKFMLQTKDKKESQIQHQYRQLDLQIWGDTELKQTEMSLLTKENVK